MAFALKSPGLPAKSPDSYTFTVGKLDAGMAILLGERAHLIEFPSLLLPPGATTGSIVNILVTQNTDAERKRDAAFWQLQDDILETFGRRLPTAPEITVRNVTQTSVALEWPPLDLATATLRSLDIYRNGARLASIPSPLTNTTTKLSGLDLNASYTFRLVLRTSAGNFPSNVASVRTHTMADTSGISVCFGTITDPRLREQAQLALREMKAKWTDKIQIDTTHFVCTTPAAQASNPNGSSTQLASAPGVEYQRALQMSIPVVQPQWILACLAEKKMVPIASYYLGATPAAPINAAPFTRPQSLSQTSLPRSASATTTTTHARAQSTPQGPSATSSAPPSAQPGLETAREAPHEEEEEDEEGGAEDREREREREKEREEEEKRRSPKTPHARQGTMDRSFKFPPPKPEDAPPVPALPASVSRAAGGAPSASAPAVESTSSRATQDARAEEAELTAPGPAGSASRKLNVEVPPPPTLAAPEKERSPLPVSPDEELGETEEISLA